jgi:hypothetical protein
MKKVGRNDPCFCGSGKKYKNCHELSATSVANSTKSFWIIAILILLLIFAIFSIVYSPSYNQSDGPSGTPPAGKVWSEEHGHWHDL